MIRVEHLMKIFGDEPERAIPLLADGLGKDEIRERTGLVVGVNDVSFETEPGEIFVIMGLSGSGKSTLLRCINRLIEPVSGKVYLAADGGEIDVTALTRSELRKVRREKMSMVFQRFGLLPHRRVVDNVGYGLEIQRREAGERRRLAEEMLEVVGLGGWSDAYPSELSGGMQQRVGLARALATQAEVLLMDEPFSALDPLIKVEMQNELLRIQNELERTILFITHDLDEALRIGTHVAIMEGGVVVQQGTPEEIIVNPQSQYVSDFVEHADPTGVMTAATVMLPLPGTRFEETRRSDSVTFYIRKGYPEREYGLDRDGRFAEMRVDGTRAQVRPLAEMIEEPLPELRMRDTVLTCTPDTVLKDVLRGRTYSILPQLVLEPTGEVAGVISENELIHGILYKRAYEETRLPEPATRAARSEARR